MSLITATFDRISGREQRTFAVACGAHVLHDGYTDLLYVLLPLWQTEFALDYAAVGLLRALYVGAMAGFQMPAGLIAERFGGPLLLGLGTALAGIGYLVAGASVSFSMLVGALIIGGLGSGVQHPISANLVSQAFPGGALAWCARRLQFLRRSRQNGVSGRNGLAPDSDAVAGGHSNNRHGRPRHGGGDPLPARDRCWAACGCGEIRHCHG